MAKKTVKETKKKLKKVEKVETEKEKITEKEKLTESAAQQETTEKLPFPNSVVVRIMRQHLDPGKQIKKRVKVEMNKWLAEMLAKVTEEMNKQPYRTIDYAMFKDAIAKYTKLEEIADERERLLGYVNKIKSDCEYMEKEIRRRFSLEEDLESIAKQE